MGRTRPRRDSPAGRPGEPDGRTGKTASAARRLALQTLCEVDQGAPLDRTLDRHLGKSSLDARDRALATQLVQGGVRLRRYLDWGIDHYLSGPIEELPLPIRNTLRLAFFQLIYMDRIPDRAVVDEHVTLARAFGHRGTASLVNAVLRSFLRADRRIPTPAGEETVAGVAIETSHPEWLIRRWAERDGLDEARQLGMAGNRIPGLSLRVNRLRTGVEALREKLGTAGIESEPGRVDPWVLRLARSAHVPDIPGFDEGWFQIQDESSSLVGLMADPAPGERVLDLCCGVGGKTTHLAELMGDQGMVIGIDRARWRLRSLHENCRRLGIRSVSGVQADLMSFSARPVDLVLLDAPCSGTGVLARRADARWQRTESDIPRLASLQREMLEAAAAWVATGGRLVYSVCSLEPEECEDVITEFVGAHPEFELEPLPEFFPAEVGDRGMFVRTSPHRNGMDGMFAARMRKVNS